MGEMEIYGVPLEGLLSVGAVLILLLFVLWLAAWLRIGKLKRRFQAFTNGTGVQDLDQVITKMHERIEQLTVQGGEGQQRIGALEQKTMAMKSHIGVLRYNPFYDGGSELSFSVAIVDDRQDGVVISSLHSREESRVYAKPIQSGTSEYVLTPEEKEAISLAKRKS